MPLNGTVNALCRIGERLAARLPLRPGDPDAVRSGLAAEAAAAVGRSPARAVAAI